MKEAHYNIYMKNVETLELNTIVPQQASWQITIRQAGNFIITNSGLEKYIGIICIKEKTIMYT